jgi:peptidoglycan/LPS O-acetylase OafA/YrhL
LIPSPFTTSAASSKGAVSLDKITVLDGLRGVACLIVFHEHWTTAIDDPWRPSVLNDLSTGIMWKPFVVLLWGGEAMVNLFFVISGYVLSYRPLSLLYASEQQKMYESVASSIFRRAFRLWLPTMAGILIIATLTRLHVFEPARHVYEYLNAAQAAAIEATKDLNEALDSGKVLPKGMRTNLMRESLPPMAPSTVEQFVHAIKECFLLIRTSVVGEVKKTDILAYDAHIWTIPTEFNSSIKIFTLVIGTSMFTSRWRLLIHGTVMVYCALQEYRTALFVAGMMAAEIDLIKNRYSHAARAPRLGSLLADESAPQDTSSLHARFNNGKIFWSLSLVIGVYILSIPYVEPVTASPYVFFAALLPDSVANKNRLIRAIGAVMTTWSCVHSGIAAPIFNSGVAQYLGRISFALYLVHGMMIRSLGYLVIWWLREYTGAITREVTSGGQFAFIWLVGYVVMLPLCLWAADLFWRSIDIPAAQFARWLERRLKGPHRGDLEIKT